VFHPFVVTTLGEEGPLAVSLREWIVMAYRAKLETALATMGRGFRI
jgi:hypothetical protein